jgi:16S rRNA (cytosine967-C5)-methyltransferase
LWRKDLSDVMAQAQVQRRLIAAAAEMVRPGGTLVYCVCSLAREEGEDVVETFLPAHPNFAREKLNASDVFDQPQFVTPAGDLRTLPSHWPEYGGLDGFYAARLRRTA